MGGRGGGGEGDAEGGGEGDAEGGGDGESGYANLYHREWLLPSLMMSFGAPSKYISEYMCKPLLAAFT